jgi:hypothetical protein
MALFFCAYSGFDDLIEKNRGENRSQIIFVTQIDRKLSAKAQQKHRHSEKID